MKKEPTVDMVLDLGEFKVIAQREAKKAGVGLNEFICNALESRIRQNREYEPKNYTPHGGKHLMGKHTGYEITKDGRYYPAPSWTQQFDHLFSERSAITFLANSIVAQSQERLVKVEDALLKAKEGLVDDLGLDPAKPWVYHGGEDGYLDEQPKAKRGRK